MDPFILTGPSYGLEEHQMNQPGSHRSRKPVRNPHASVWRIAPNLFALACLLATAQCKKNEDALDHSRENPPADLAGTYRLTPAYNEETLIIQSGGETEYRVKRPGETAIRRGLAYQNRFRLIIFLDGDADPTGIFLLQDREKRWAGRWRGEMRFLEGVDKPSGPEAGK